MNIPEISEKYFLQRWKPRDKTDIRDLRYNIPVQFTEDNSQLRYNVLSKECIHVASEGSKINEKYMYVTDEIKKIAKKLHEMSMDEERSIGTGTSSKHDTCADLSGYGNLLDPHVQPSKGRPRGSGKQKADGRFKTLGEQNFLKHRITCSQCGSNEHNIQTCGKLHMDASVNAKKSKERKKPKGNLNT
jgi:hypothetical protein